MQIDKKKNKLINEYELRNKSEINEFVDKIRAMGPSPTKKIY